MKFLSVSTLVLPITLGSMALVKASPRGYDKIIVETTIRQTPPAPHSDLGNYFEDPGHGDLGTEAQKLLTVELQGDELETKDKNVIVEGEFTHSGCLPMSKPFRTSLDQSSYAIRRFMRRYGIWRVMYTL